MDNALFNAILAMDSYNRGYVPALDLHDILHWTVDSDATDTHP
jgi:hypothetical protein